MCRVTYRSLQMSVAQGGNGVSVSRASPEWGGVMGEIVVFADEPEPYWGIERQLCEDIHRPFPDSCITRCATENCGEICGASSPLPCVGKPMPKTTVPPSAGGCYNDVP